MKNRIAEAEQLARDMQSVADRMRTFSYETAAKRLYEQAKEIRTLFACERCPHCDEPLGKST